MRVPINLTNYVLNEYEDIDQHDMQYDPNLSNIKSNHYQIFGLISLSDTN